MRIVFYTKISRLVRVASAPSIALLVMLYPPTAASINSTVQSSTTCPRQCLTCHLGKYRPELSRSEMEPENLFCFFLFRCGLL